LNSPGFNSSLSTKSQDLNGSRGIVLVLLVAAALRLLGLWHSYSFSYYGHEIHSVEQQGTMNSLPGK
jgi:hypothetical protein